MSLPSERGKHPLAPAAIPHDTRRHPSWAPAIDARFALRQEKKGPPPDTPGYSPAGPPRAEPLVRPIERRYKDFCGGTPDPDDRTLLAAVGVP